MKTRLFVPLTINSSVYLDWVHSLEFEAHLASRSVGYFRRPSARGYAACRPWC